MDKIIFTKHAEEKLRDRKISRGLVLRTIRSPEKIVVDSEKLYAFRQFGKKYLKVIFKRVDTTIVIRTHLKNHFCFYFKTSATTCQKKLTRYAVYCSLFLTASRSKFCNLATKAFLRWVLLNILLRKYEVYI